VSGEKSPTQTWVPERYEKNAGFVADLGQATLELLAPASGERILDLGCGHGKLSRKIADLGVELVAVDASAEQVAAASALGLDARVMRGEALDFEAEFDAVFSNAALHWMLDADAVIDGVARALKQGGRFVGEMGGSGNVEKIAKALTEVLQRRGIDAEALWPWYFPGPEEYQGRLEKVGFEVDFIALIDRPTPLPGDIEGWLETFAESFLKAVSDDDRPAFIAEVRDALGPELKGADGTWSADYVRLRFKAVLPGDGA